MKRLIAFVLAAASLFLFAACGGKAEEDEEFCAQCSKEELTELLNGDDISSRVQAAAACGRFGDLDFLPELEEILNSPDESGLHAAALSSLEMLWYDAPRYENIHEEAYLVLKAYLQHQPGEALPAVEAFRPFTEKVQEKWLLGAGWFNRDELVEIIQQIADDPACSGEYRETVEQAIKVLNAIQASLPGACNLTW